VGSARKQSRVIDQRPRCAWLLCLAVLCLAAPAHGQSLGDIARQERARKASQQQAQQPTHIYDNDDLTRPQILVPEDKQRVEAPTQQVTAPASAAPPAAPVPIAPASAAAQTTTPAPASNVSYVSNASNTNSPPLGDIARYYRAQKAARQQQAPQSAAQHPAPATPPAAQATNAAATSNESDSISVTFVSPPANLDSMPLGDIARYYRAQKAARQQQATQSAKQHPAPANLPAAPATNAAAASNESNSSSMTFVSAPPNLNSMPLGDIARYYRAQKAARQQEQQAPQSAEQYSLPAAPPLAYPTFTSPPARPSPPLVPATEGPPQVQPAPNAISREEDRAAKGGTARVKVQRGDTLWNLARKYLGHGRKWTVLAADNPQLPVPTRLQIGAWVRLPLPDDGPDSGSGEQVRVQAGDSLWKLSQAHFGDGGAWGCIARANPELRNANLILSGQILTIPGSCAAADPGTHATARSAEALPTSTVQLPSPVN